MGDRHVNVGGKDCQQQKHQSISRYSLKFWKKQAGTTRDFSNSTDENQQPRHGQERWDDSAIWLRKKEVQQSRHDEKNGKDESSGHRLIVLNG